MRYHRQIIIPEIDKNGQDKLLKSRVLIVGAGGLGSIVAFYIAASGVGYIGIIDPDIVELSNLQRQILHNEEHIGMPKAISAFINLRKLNSEIKVLPYPDEINKKNVSQYLPHFDIVVACPDNFKTRIILNEASFKFLKPLVVGAVSEFEGHVFNVIPPKGPCYNCLFNEAQDDNITRGILAPIAGVIGSIMTVETIKILLNLGEILHSRMLIYDGLKGKFREVKFLRDISCKICK